MKNIHLPKALFIVLVLGAQCALADHPTDCMDFLIGSGEVRMDWIGDQPGSETHKNAQAKFTLIRSQGTGVGQFNGFFQAKKSHKWDIQIGEINGNSFSFTTAKNARENKAGLKGGGTCSKTTAEGTFWYYGEGDGYSYTFKMYKK